MEEIWRNFDFTASSC